MSHLVDAIIEVIVYVCGWRILFCFGLAGGLAYLLYAYGVFLFHRLDIPVATVILGFVIGGYWEVRANESVS